MSDHDHHSGWDEDAPLKFEGGRRRSRGPAPTTLIISVLLLIIAGGGVMLLYRGGARDDAAPRTLGAPIGPTRASPKADGSADASQGLSVSRDGAPPSGGAPNYAPAPESPLPPPTVAAPAGGAVQPAPAVTAPPAAAQPATPPLAQPAVRTATAPKGGGDTIGRLIDENTPPRPARRAEPAAKPKPEPAKVEKAVAAAGGDFAVQIGAFSTEALAQKQWRLATQTAPGSMAGKGRSITPVERDGSTLYRTAITGFGSREEARAACAKLTAGGLTCFVH